MKNRSFWFLQYDLFIHTVDSSGLKPSILNQCHGESIPNDKLNPNTPLSPPNTERKSEEKGSGVKNLNQYFFHYRFDSWVFSDYFSTPFRGQRKIVFFGPFFFTPNYQPALSNGNDNQGASCHVLTHLFAFSSPLAPQVRLIGQIDGAWANWTK